MITIALGVLGLGLVVFVAILLFPSGSIVNNAEFEEIPIDLTSYGLFDLGIVDVDQDSNLDIFTSNHSGPQSVLLNKGSAQFEDRFSAFQLDQDHMFPGLVVLPNEPKLHDPGIYIHWRGPSIIIRAHNMPNAVSGSIEILSPLIIEQNQNFNTTLKQEVRDQDVTHSVIEFDGEGEGFFSFKPYLHALPIKITFDSQLTPAQIFVGSDYKSPATLTFSLNMKDRHGMAWADYNADGLTDLYIARGGLKGWMGRMPGTFWDEMFISTENKFIEVGAKYGLIKQDCSGRQAAWVDYNADDKLDLYVACGKGDEYQPNKLYQQTSDGTFNDVAAQAGLNIGAEGSFIWLDAEMDGDLDLFWVDREAFYLYENTDGKFTRSRLGINPSGQISKKLTVADFDKDGDFDIFSASPNGNVLCINIEGDYILADPVSWGLPGKSMTANWLDYDNDGLQDLHTIPAGLFKQQAPNKFINTAMLQYSDRKFASSKLNAALASWFDMDNDGKRDLILALDFGIKQRWWSRGLAVIDGTSRRLGGLKSYWDVALFRSEAHSANHWLQVELLGSPGNQPAIGSVVTIYSVGHSKQVQQVGMSEGARYSQGHYRLYFGLGKSVAPFDIEISWPDGIVQKINSVEPNQLLIVKRQTLPAS